VTFFPPLSNSISSFFSSHSVVFFSSLSSRFPPISVTPHFPLFTLSLFPISCGIALHSSSQRWCPSLLLLFPCPVFFPFLFPPPPFTRDSFFFFVTLDNYLFLAAVFFSHRVFAHSRGRLGGYWSGFHFFPPLCTAPIPGNSLTFLVCGPPPVFCLFRSNPDFPPSISRGPYILVVTGPDQSLSSLLFSLLGPRSSVTSPFERKVLSTDTRFFLCLILHHLVPSNFFTGPSSMSHRPPSSGRSVFSDGPVLFRFFFSRFFCVGAVHPPFFLNTWLQPPPLIGLIWSWGPDQSSRLRTLPLFFPPQPVFAPPFSRWQSFFRQSENP